MINLIIACVGILFLLYQLSYIRGSPAEGATLETPAGHVYSLGPYQQFQNTTKGAMLKKQTRPSLFGAKDGFCIYERGGQYFLEVYSEDKHVTIVSPGRSRVFRLGDVVRLEDGDIILYNDQKLFFG